MFLIGIANRNHLVHRKIIEQLATEKDIQQYSELDSVLQTTPFFLVMTFDKNYLRFNFLLIIYLLLKKNHLVLPQRLYKKV